MKDMTIQQYVVGPVQTNCYIALHAQTKQALIIDPGDAGSALADKIKESGAKPVAILLTHGHFDHADGVEDLIASFSEDIPVYAHEAEKDTLERTELNLSPHLGGSGKSYHADVFVRDGEELSLAGFTIRVLHTPGHTEGGCCYYVPKEAVVFSGDSLFREAIGRTDFLRSSTSALVRSVKEKLLTLPEDVLVLPGHDARSDIGHEKVYNPFLQ